MRQLRFDCAHKSSFDRIPCNINNIKKISGEFLFYDRMINFRHCETASDAFE